MAVRHGGDANIPGLHRDPLDFRGVDRELNRRSAQVEVPPPFVERPPITALEVMGFAWVYLKDHYDRFVPYEKEPGSYGWSPFQVDRWQVCCNEATWVAIAAPRGFAKSTDITLAYGLASICLRRVSYLIIVSDTFEGQAIEHVRDYQRELRENDKLRADCRIKKLVKDVEGDLIIQFEDGALARVKALGMEGAIRGLRWRSKRPELFIIDDAENPELVESKIRRDKSRKWIMNDLIPAGGKGARVRMVGTIMHADASLARFTDKKKSPSWHSKIYRAHQSFDDFTNLLWPEMWPEERLRKERQRYIEQNDSDGYSQEYLNDPISPTDAYFTQDDLQECDPYDLSKPGEYYIGWDFAVSKEDRRDYTVASIWKVDAERRKIKVAMVRDRFDARQIVDKMLELDRTYEPKCHLVEKGMIEKAIEPFLDDRMLAEERYLNVVKITRNKDKETFAKPLQGMVRRHDLTFNKKMPDWAAVEHEYLRFPKAEHDDIIDSDSIIAQGLRELVSAPTEEELSAEEFFRSLKAPSSPFDLGGRNRTTGY